MDQAVDGPVRRFNRRDAIDHIVLARHIERLRPKRNFAATYGFRRDVANHDAVAVLRQQPRRRRADTAAAAGDQDDAVRCHEFPSFFLDT